MQIDHAQAYSLTPRERDTVIAALRFWQRLRSTDGNIDEFDIAVGDRRGEGSALLDDEIDALIETCINA